MLTAFISFEPCGKGSELVARHVVADYLRLNDHYIRPDAAELLELVDRLRDRKAGTLDAIAMLRRVAERDG